MGLPNLLAVLGLPGQFNHTFVCTFILQLDLKYPWPGRFWKQTASILFLAPPLLTGDVNLANLLNKRCLSFLIYKVGMLIAPTSEN